jgi:flagellin
VGAGTDAATDIIKVSNAVMGGGTAAAASSVSSSSDVDDLMATVYTTMGTGTTGLSISGTAGDVANIDSAINAIDAALDKVNGTRADFGAAQNRFDAVISSLQVNIENQSAARGRIVDADFAAETANLSRSQILQQAGTAMIAQANQLPQSVLQLLR